MNDFNKKSANLLEYLLKHHPNDIQYVTKNPPEIQLKHNPSIHVREGYACALEWADHSKITMVNLLKQEFNYSDVDAKKAYYEAINNDCGNYSTSISAAQPISEAKSLILPYKNDNNRRVFAYLTKTRGISPDTVNFLIKAGKLYESKERHNCIFINEEDMFAEIRGTISGKKFNGVATGSKKDGIWCFHDPSSNNISITSAYICEAAIDAISLYEIHKTTGIHTKAFYCSIAGASKHETVSRICNNTNLQVIIASDNDTAGDSLRIKFPNLQQIRPVSKDWNEDLLNYLKKKHIA